MKDIASREDLEILLREFYNSLLQDSSINYIFIDVAKIDLEEHLPHITDFWEQNLFNSGSYKNNVMRLHLDLNDKENLTTAHFDTWLTHFYTVTDKVFAGVNAEKIKTRALSIATVMKVKILKP
jgi:hemoglobin